jgi:hypothetical protein
MRKVNFFKKLKLFFEYRRLLKSIDFELETNLNARIDSVSRIYTVINLPEDVIEEPYNFRKSDIDALAQTFIKQYTSDLSTFLNKKGLSELYNFYEIKKVSKYSYLLVFGFSQFDSKKVAIRFIWTLVSLVTILTLFILKH